MNLRGRSKVKTEFSMASMTDLVFLLLIFFVITSTMVTPTAIKLLLPKSSIQETPKNRNINVQIDAKTNFYVNDKPVSEDRLPAAINEVLSTMDRTNETEAPTIALAADQSVPVEHVVKVMNVAKTLKLRIILITSPE